jgi:AraC-like DNA-binding protein
LKGELYCVFSTWGNYNEDKFVLTGYCGSLAVLKKVAQSEAISARQMYRKFEQWIGVNPKKFCEVVGFSQL